MIINIHAGHNPDGKVACGAVGLIKESTEARKVKDKVIALLKADGNTVYDCTVDDGTSQSNVLSKIVAKCNAHKADLDVSIHFNAGRNDYIGDGSIGGTEAFCISTTTKAVPYAQRIVKNIASLGFKLRDDALKDDIKTSTSLYFLKKTNAPAVLVECCFVDDADDVKLYNADSMAKAIAEGIAGKTLGETKATAPVSNYYPKYTGTSTSIITALLSVGEKDTSLAHRKKIATENGISSYKGTSSQNLTLVSLVKSGKLVKA